MGKFYRRGTTRFYALPAVANPAVGPTRPELTAGTWLRRIATVGGFSISNSPVPTPDLDARFTTSVPGEDTAENPSLTFWDDPQDTTNRDVLAKDTDLYIVYMPYGDVPGERCEVWDVRSTGVNDQIDLAAAGQFQVGFSVNEVPNQNAIIPAA
jgi:hypothetical protein